MVTYDTKYFPKPYGAKLDESARLRTQADGLRAQSVTWEFVPENQVFGEGAHWRRNSVFIGLPLSGIDKQIADIDTEADRLEEEGLACLKPQSLICR